MTALHYFRIKDEVQAPNEKNVNIVLTVLLEGIVDIWLDENQIGGFIKSPTFEDKRNGKLIGFTASDWAFFNELDAMQFKLRFGDQFDYCVMDQEGSGV